MARELYPKHAVKTKTCPGSPAGQGASPDSTQRSSGRAFCHCCVPCSGRGRVATGAKWDGEAEAQAWLRAAVGRELFVQEAWALLLTCPEPSSPPAPSDLPRRMFVQGPAEQMASSLWPGSLMGTDLLPHPRQQLPVSSGQPGPGQRLLCCFSASLSRGIPGVLASSAVQGLMSPTPSVCGLFFFYH